MRPSEVAGARVQDALRFARRARRIKHEERVLGVERGGLLGLAEAGPRGTALEPVLPPDVAPFLHRHRLPVGANATNDHDLLDAGRLRDGSVRHFLERYDVAAPPGAVLRQEHLGTAVVDAIAQRVRAEASEDDRVRRANARAGKQRDDRLRHHAHVNGDAVARSNTEVGQRGRRAHDFAVQFEVRQSPRVPRLAFPHESGLRAARGRQVPVQAALAHVERAAEEELGLWQCPVDELRPRRAPNELARLFTPEHVRLFERLAVHRRVRVVRRDACLVHERMARMESALFFESRLDVIGHGRKATMRSRLT